MMKWWVMIMNCKTCYHCDACDMLASVRYISARDCDHYADKTSFADVGYRCGDCTHFKLVSASDRHFAIGLAAM